MRVLIDTNIFIQREDNRVLKGKIQNLIRKLNDLSCNILIHPESIKDIQNDGDKIRKQIMLSKLKSYSSIESPPDPSSDNSFINLVGVPKKSNDKIDDVILYSVLKNAVDFLITEDEGIHNKSRKLRISDRVLFIEEAINLFESYYKTKGVYRPLALKDEYVYNLDINDAIFDSLKNTYPEFKNWFMKISSEPRKCWVYYKDENTIGAILIYKDEEELIASEPLLPDKRRFKICTFKVSDVGHKIGELFIKLSTEYCIKNNIEEIYLTHFSTENGYLIDLISEYGFIIKAKLKNNEDVYVKEIKLDIEKIRNLNPTEIAKKYYPYFYDGSEINKFIIPIRPEYSERLFIDYPDRQSTLNEISNFIVESNTIEKAYLCHSKNKSISSGDIIIFYISKIQQVITIGIVEKIVSNLLDIDEIIRHVAKRTVYSIDEIQIIAQKPTMVILFISKWNFNKPLNLRTLKKCKILKGAPQSITQISHEKYLLLKRRGELNEHFAIN